MKNKQTDSQLLEQIQADNMLAYNELYERYHRRLLYFSNDILKSRDDAENIVHEVFLKVWENRHSIEKVGSYIFSVAYNATISLIRKKVSEEKFLEYYRTLPESYESPVNIDIEYSELKERAQTIIEALPERQKEVYLLSREKELTYREIAEKLNISVNTVENHMVKALAAIRKELEKLSLLGILFFYIFI